MMPRLRRKSTALRQKQSRDLMTFQRGTVSMLSGCVSGSIHQASEIDELHVNNRGKQCTCVALISAVSSLTHSPVHRTSEDINGIVLAGDVLYSKHHGTHDYLLTTDLPSQVSYNDVVYSVITIDGFCGSLSTVQSNPPNYAIIDALDAAFDVSPKVILQLGSQDQAYASMIENLGPRLGFFIFDSHARDERGFPDGAGFAVQLRCSGFRNLSTYITSLAVELGVEDSQFELCPIVIFPDSISATSRAAGGDVCMTVEDDDNDVEDAVTLRQYTVQYMHTAEEKARRKEQQRTCKGELERKKETRQKDKISRGQLNIRVKRLTREKQQRSQPDVRAQVAERVKKHRSEPAVKARRKWKEQQQRSVSVVKEKRALREKQQRTNPGVQKKRSQRETVQRSNPEVRARRSQREKVQRSNPEVQKKRSQRETVQRSNREVRARRSQRETVQRSNPEVRARRSQREKVQRSNPEVQKKRSQREKVQRSNPEVREKRSQREKLQMLNPAIREKKSQRTKEQRLNPEVRVRRSRREKEQRSNPKVHEKRSLRETQQRSRPQVKEKRSLRETQQRSRPQVKEKRSLRETQQRSEPDVKKGRSRREGLWRSQPGVITARRMVVRQKRQREREKRKEVSYAVSVFRDKVSKIPDCICCICQRIRFHNQVVRLTKYQWSKHGQILKDCGVMEESSYSCTYCQKFINKGKMPPLCESGNKLRTGEMPPHLTDLNALERYLVTPVIPFMKVVSLPSGSQKGIHGPVVCVPSNMEQVVATLPRPIDDTGLIKVKLKRKLNYKGHHLYQQVSTVKVQEALQHLKDHHKNFTDICHMQEIPSHEETPAPEVANMITEGMGGDVQNAVEEDRECGGVELSAQINETSAPLVTCLQPEDLSQYIADNYEDEILCVAPAEGNKPQSIRDKEAVAFPTLFPDGENTFNERRETKVTFPQYIKARLLSANAKFASNPDYIFFLQFMKEYDEVMSSARISLRKGAHPNTGNVSAAEMIQGGNLKNLVQRNHGFKFLAKVRGSAPYWQGAMRDLCAMVRQLGLPTWFCSFSAADRRWPEIVRAILTIQQGAEAEVDIPEDIDWSEHCHIINSNPVIAAMMFDRRVQSLMTDLLLSDSQVIGEVVDFFYRVEFQQRGWPHLHGIFWVKGAPLLSQSSSDNDAEVCQFIDQYVCPTLPDAEAEPDLYEKVTSVQVHSKNHSRTCRKGSKVCRFNFPKPASTRTFICRPLEAPAGVDPAEWKLTANKKLEVYWEVLSKEENEGKTAAEVLAIAGLTQSDFETTLCAVAKKTSVILQRNPKDIWVNPYNPTLLNAWNANLDVQYVVDAYSCIAYVLSYISKKEAEEGELLKAAQQEARYGNKDAVAELRQIGQTYLTHREVSIMEAIYRALGFNLKKCSREVKWIPTADDATKMTLPIRTLMKIAERDQECTDIFQTTDVERYKCRPHTHQFEDMCLAEFISNYRMVYGRSSDAEDDSDDEEDDSGYVKLLDGRGYVKKRRKAAVIRYMRVSKNKDPEQHYEHLLKLFLPHRSTDGLCTGDATYEGYFSTGIINTRNGVQRVQDVVGKNAACYDVSATIDDVYAEIREHGVEEEAWAQVAPNAECQREDVPAPVDEDEESCTDLPDLDEALPGGCAHQQSGVVSHVERVDGTNRTDAHKMMRSMNTKQRMIFMTVRSWCIEKSTGSAVTPFYIFLTGGAGTGKSHVVKALEYEANQLLRSTCDRPDDITVLKVAYTGTAAFNISGQTIHSALRIRVNTSRAQGSYKYQPLGEDLLTGLRAKYRCLQILIIDEVSMVGRKMMMTVSERLKQIKRNSRPFGGVSVFAVGDFYQIAPVGDTAVYKEDPGQIVESPWSVFQVWQLDEIMRQKDDLQYAQLLNVLRTHKKGLPLDKDHVDLLLSRKSEESKIPDGTIHIFPRNKEVNEYNAAKLTTSCSDITHIDAADVYVTGSKEHKRSTPVNHGRMMLQGAIEVAVDARVMLTTNVDVADGLSNGVIGTVVKVASGRNQYNQPKCIFIRFDNDRVGLNAKQKNAPNHPNNVVAIMPTTEDFKHQGSTMRRYQYPIKLAWACTIHKTQGMTLTSAAVSLNHIFLPGMAYVALSRISSLSGLYLLDCDEKFIYSEPHVEQSMRTMASFQCMKMPLLDDADKVGHLLIITLNVHSLLSHIEDIRHDQELLTSDVLGFCETWLSPHIDSGQLTIEGFHPPIRCDRESGSGRGGVALYVRKGLRYRCIPEMALKDIEGLVLSIEDITIVLLYRPPSFPQSRLCDEMQSLRDKVPPGRSVICGDFNIDIQESPCVVPLTELEDYQQVITEPTYYDGRRKTSLLDHIYIKNCILHRAGVISTYYSDHDATFASI